MNMFEVDGVASISNIDFEPRFEKSDGYSGIIYDMSVEGVNFDKKKGIVYPPADISIFELKYPEKNIIATNV